MATLEISGDWAVTGMGEIRFDDAPKAKVNDRLWFQGVRSFMKVRSVDHLDQGTRLVLSDDRGLGIEADLFVDLSGIIKDVVWRSVIQ